MELAKYYIVGDIDHIGAIISLELGWNHQISIVRIVREALYLRVRNVSFS